MMFKALDIANFYIKLANEIADESIDNLKINKLLYYAQGFSLAIIGEPLFSDEIQAWDYGPVIPEVYHTFKCCGKKAIDCPVDEFDENRLSNEQLTLLTDVFSTYGKYTGWALKEMTHKKGSPWQLIYEAGKNNVIDQESMRKYFVSESLDRFDLAKLHIPIVKEIPADWDSDGDNVYG